MKDNCGVCHQAHVPEDKFHRQIIFSIVTIMTVLFGPACLYYFDVLK
jgi:hypothetical protein